MPLFQIKNRFNEEIIFEKDCDSMRLCVGAAVESGVNLPRANLSGANLSGADLPGADLSGADLSGANLSRVNLPRANLSGANLSRVNLPGANLSGANLSGAYLSGANLSGAYLYGADLSGVNLSGADLSGVNLYGANLYGANLSRVNLPGANLSRVNLPGANLYGADLSGANLSGANLYGAYLSRANGVNPNRCTPLLMLLDQPGKIRAYKLVTDEFTGPVYPSFTYKIGEEYSVTEPNTNVNALCGAGISLATLDWCMKGWNKGMHILIAEFEAKDIAAIPTATDGKFRVSKCKIVGEKDLKEIGLIEG